MYLKLSTQPIGTGGELEILDVFFHSVCFGVFLLFFVTSESLSCAISALLNKRSRSPQSSEGAVRAGSFCPSHTIPCGRRVAGAHCAHLAGASFIVTYDATPGQLCIQNIHIQPVWT